MTWYKNGKLPRLWRYQSRKSMGSELQDAKRFSVDSNFVSPALPLVTKSETATPAYKSRDTGDSEAENNIYSRPIMNFVEVFNDVSMQIVNGNDISATDVDDVLGEAYDVLSYMETYNEGTEKDIAVLQDVVAILEDLHQMFFDNTTVEDRYDAWFESLNVLKQSDDIARYVVVINSPDEQYGADVDMLPAQLQSEVPGQIYDDYYGIRNTLPDEDGAEDDYDEDFVVDISESAMSAWKGRDLASIGTKHDLSLQQIHSAFDVIYKKVMNANGGYILSGPLFLNVSQWEIDALIEEGLVKQKGNRITLTRQGWEKPQWYNY